jgi:transcriptional regulator with XRE-family HTH domain
MTELDPFAGLGKALAYLRQQAGFSTQTEASEKLGIDKGQLSRWEHESPRPTLENLGRVLAGYGATLSDLVVALGSASQLVKDRGPTDEELIQSLAEAIRRVEGRQVEAESRQIEAESRIERLEKDLGKTTG